MYFRVIPDKSIKVSPSNARKKKVAAGLQLRMFYVGEGECILIVFPNKDAWLVDCGRTTAKTSNEKLADDLITYLEENELFLKVIIPSHPHSDHARAITTLISLMTESIANPVKIYRSDDKGWENTKPKWLKPYREAVASFANEIIIRNDKKKRVTIAKGISAHLFASGNKARKNYRSLFMHLRYHDAKLLFTGDAYKRYEKAMLKKFGKQFFAVDVLKVTHHGSKGGTDKDVLAKIQPGIAIASTGEGKGHDLHSKTRKIIKNRGARIFETGKASNGNLSARDVVIETDGKRIDSDGILYQARRLARKFK